MREIKFRAWDKERKQWVKPTVYFVPTGSSDNYKEMFLEPEGKGEFQMDNFHIALLQFTGLKDKNGKEIYEGDIVCFDFHSGKTNRICQWGDSEGAWYFDHFRFSEMELLNNASVIGNVYENPELLQ